MKIRLLCLLAFSSLMMARPARQSKPPKHPTAPRHFDAQQPRKGLLSWQALSESDKRTSLLFLYEWTDALQVPGAEFSTGDRLLMLKILKGELKSLPVSAARDKRDPNLIPDFQTETAADDPSRLREALLHTAAVFADRTITGKTKTDFQGALLQAAEELLKNDMVGSVRAAAADTLGGLGSEALPALPALVLATSDRDLIVRANCAEALVNIDPQSRQVLQHLLDRLPEEKESRTRIVFIHALEKIGSTDSRVLETLADLESDKRCDITGLCVGREAARVRISLKKQQ